MQGLQATQVSPLQAVQKVSYSATTKKICIFTFTVSSWQIYVWMYPRNGETTIYSPEFFPYVGVDAIIMRVVNG